MSRLAELHRRLDVVLPETCYRADLLASLNEMAICINEHCYIAVMALAGKTLEICLKHRMNSRAQSFDDSWMLGTLLKKMKESDDGFVDPALGNIANIINQSRIPAVHAKSNVPIPTEDQAGMVVRATCDVIERTLLAAG